MKNIGKDQGSVNIGNINNVTGSELNIAGRDLHIQDHPFQSEGNSSNAFQQFQDISRQINMRNDLLPDDKDDLKNHLKELESENEKGEMADESFLQRCLRSIGRIAPDILEVVLKTFVSPVDGISSVLKKVVEKMLTHPHK